MTEPRLQKADLGVTRQHEAQGRGVRAMRRGQTEQPPGSADTLLRLGQFRLDHAPCIKLNLEGPRP